jgi:hypothetical protein
MILLARSYLHDDVVGVLGGTGGGALDRDLAEERRFRPVPVTSS